MRVFALLLSLVLLTGPRGLAQSAVDSIPRLAPTVLLISIDGFRWDYLDTHASSCPTLNELANEGVQAKGLVPVFPSLTFPNHYSIVTGLYPGNHGIVANYIYDRARNDTFTISNKRKVGDGRWWGGEPIWVTAHKAGLRSASMFWPGSEAPIQGVRPNHWLSYDDKMPHQARVDTLLQWLDHPQGKRPQMLTLYFSAVDHAGHEADPNSAEVAQAIDSVDNAIDYLTSQLRQRGLLDQINIIIVSDHGMATNDSNRVARTNDLIPQDWLQGGFPHTAGSLYLKPGMAEAAYEQLRRTGGSALRAYRKAETPKQWHYRTHPNIGDIVVVANEGGTILRPNAKFKAGGSHGYDPALQSMHGILIARGPAFAQDATIGRVQNIHLYSLMCKLLGIAPAPNDGDWRKLKGLLR